MKYHSILQKVFVQLFLSVLLLLISDHIYGQRDTLTVLYSDDFEVDGRGDNNNWNTTKWINIPSRSPEESRETKAKILYSTTGIYFLFNCEDDYITSTLTEDFENLYKEDVVEIFLWTDEAFPFYFEYELSPTNYELPIFVPNVEGDFFGWRPWHYEGSRKTRHATYVHKMNEKVSAWTAEFFIPFALLKPMANVPPTRGATWRANMYRLDYDRPTSRWTWQTITTNFHDYERFGTFLFK